MIRIPHILAIALMSSLSHAKEITSPAENSIESFEKLFGATKGKRRNHTKGFCFTGTMSPDKKSMKSLSSSSLFHSDSEVIGRFSHKGGNALAADDKPGEFGMALAFKTASNETHIMAMNTLDFFPVSSPEAFAALMAAKVRGPASVKKFKSTSDELKRFSAHHSKKAKEIKPYENMTFNSINSFYLINNQKNKTPIRWAFVPKHPVQLSMKPTSDFLFAHMNQSLLNTEVSWDMIVTLANKNDQVSNASIPWNGPHQTIKAAKLKIISIESEETGKCAEINFDPLVLASGIEPSPDPLLRARSQAYAISFGRRMSEKQQQ